VEMILRVVAYLSYRLPARQMRPLVPDHLPLAAVAEDQVFVTAMLFRVERARAARLPSPQVSYYQVNLMTYVRERDNEQPAIFFLRKGVNKPRVARAMRWLHMPVDRMRLRVQAERDHHDNYAFYEARGHWNGDFHLRIHQIAPRLENLFPFNNGQSAVIHLADALVGFYGAEGRTYRLEAWHPRAQPRVGEVETISFPPLETLFGPEVDLAHPAVVLLAPRHHYLIHLPPQRSR